MRIIVLPYTSPYEGHQKGFTTEAGGIKICWIQLRSGENETSETRVITIFGENREMAYKAMQCMYGKKQIIWPTTAESQKLYLKMIHQSLLVLLKHPRLLELKFLLKKRELNLV